MLWSRYDLIVSRKARALHSDMLTVYPPQVHPARRPDEKLLPPDASYIIVGGTRGIGLDIASWLPQKGARNIILISRSGAADSNTTEAIQKLRDQGVAVSICQCDVGVGQDVIRALKPALESMPRVRGVIYGAMVLRVCSPLFSLPNDTSYSCINPVIGHVI